MKGFFQKLSQQLSHYNQLVDDYNQAAAKAPDSALAYVNWGIKLSQEGDLQGAIEKFTTAAQMDPKRATCFANWGVALAKAGQLPEAIIQLEKATLLEPHNPELYSLLGAALVESGEWDKAHIIYQKATQLAPLLETLYVNWGIALARSGPDQPNHYLLAIEKFKKALEIRPYQPWVFFLWGVVLAELEEYEAAIEQFKQTLRFIPKHPEAHYFWCVCLNRLKRYPEAIALAKQGLFHHPDHADLLLQLGEALLYSPIENDLLTAMATIRHALMLKPLQAEAYELLGQALLKHNQPNEALARFEKALELDPHLKSVHAHWAKALLMLGRFDEAKIHLEKAHELDPDNTDILLHWALISLKQNQLDEALTKLFAIEAKEAWNPRLHFLLGSHYLEKSDYENAVASFSKVLEAEPAFVEAGILLALAHGGLAQKNPTGWDDAIRVLRPLLRQHPTSARILFHLGHCLFRKGDLFQAQEKFVAALHHDPLLHEARIGLAECYLLAGHWQKTQQELEPLLQNHAQIASPPQHIAVEHLYAWALLYQARQLVQSQKLSEAKDVVKKALFQLKALPPHPILALISSLIREVAHSMELTTSLTPLELPLNLHEPYRWASAQWQRVLQQQSVPYPPAQALWAEHFPWMTNLFAPLTHL
ncbi:MAG: tetratricopeptide repeat protein [Vampirovibrionales bacterium]